MPNGRPGDHPLTDILHYGSSHFGEPVDQLVKDMAQLPNFEEAREQVASLLWDLSPHWLNAVEGGREKAYKRLLVIYEQLQRR